MNPKKVYSKLLKHIYPEIAMEIYALIKELTRRRMCWYGLGGI